MKTVGVLMSTYNGEQFLQEQIESILAQEGCVIKLLVRDDGSSDGTIDILKAYEDKGKLKWYTGENLRTARSFMDLLYNAEKCDYYAFADQDDLWDYDKISSAINKLEIYDVPAFYHSNAKLADATGRTTGRLLHEKDIRINFLSLACGGGILGCTMVFNDLLRDEIIINEKPYYIRMHDYYTGFVCLACNGIGIYDSNAHINYRQHSNNVLGVAIDFKTKIKKKVKQFLDKGSCSIAEQAQEILDNYGSKMSSKKIKQCELVAKYNKTLINTVRVAFSHKTKYSSIKNSFFIRVCLLFRRR